LVCQNAKAQVPSSVKDSPDSYIDNDLKARAKANEPEIPIQFFAVNANPCIQGLGSIWLMADAIRQHYYGTLR